MSELLTPLDRDRPSFEVDQARHGKLMDQMIRAGDRSTARIAPPDQTTTRRPVPLAGARVHPPGNRQVPERPDVSSPRPQDFRFPTMTRFFDILFSSLALLLLSPILIVVAIILRFTGEGEVFFRQQRVGEGGRMFGLLKFATMLRDSPNLGSGLLTVKNDPRVLPFGRFLRKTKLNELPQLINIFVGDMSVIGPRPQARPHFEVYSEAVKVRLKTVRPGLSGIGSIVFRDEENILECAADKERFYADVIAPYKGALECWYIDRQGLVMYFTLIWLTIVAVLAPSSSAYRSVLRDLPEPPPELKGL